MSPHLSVIRKENRYIAVGVIRRMAKKAVVLAIFLSLSPFAVASGSCPINLLSGTGDASSIAITFQNVGKLPIRELELNCVPFQQPVHKTGPTGCHEANALFFPGMEYTVSYPYPSGRSERLRISLRSVTLSNGYVWKPSRPQLCRVLEIDPKKR